MKNIILIAPPAAGKGTEANLLKEEYQIPHISTGDILRSEIASNSPLSKEITDVMASGGLVKDEIILNLIEKRIANDDCKSGYVLDGFPRDIKQAQEYDKLLAKKKTSIGYVFVIDMDKEVAKSRMLARRLCPKCGKVYNLNNGPFKPKKENICDICECELISRKDDNAITYEKRYNSYLEETAPLIEYYEKKGVAYHVDGNTDKDYTHKQVRDIIDNDKY